MRIRLMFVLHGNGHCPAGGWRSHSALFAGVGEPLTLQAENDSELFIVGLPSFE
jgi:hypothetical protein